MLFSSDFELESVILRAKELYFSVNFSLGAFAKLIKICIVFAKFYR